MFTTYDLAMLLTMRRHVVMLPFDHPAALASGSSHVATRARTLLDDPLMSPMLLGDLAEEVEASEGGAVALPEEFDVEQETIYWPQKNPVLNSEDFCPPAPPHQE